ncbi:hypothetical protein ACUXMJ_002048 [Staphylococcus epidermidis]
MAKGVNQIINNIRLRKLRKILNQINALSESSQILVMKHFKRRQKNLKFI